MKRPVRSLVAYTLLTAAFVVGLYQSYKNASDIGDNQRKIVHAQREGCERTNILRENQAIVLFDQAEQNARTLRGRNLGPLETFRSEIRQGVTLRKKSLIRLLQSVNGDPYGAPPAIPKDLNRYPLERLNPDNGNLRRYRIDCNKAYPLTLK